MKRYFFIFFLLICLSCNKDSAGNLTTILSGSWRMTAHTLISPSSGYPTDWFSPGTCYSDMIWTYQRDGVFLHEAAGSCAAAGYPDSYHGTWAFINNNTSIDVKYLGSGFANFTFKIIELTKYKMKVQRMEKVAVGGSQVIEMLLQYEFVPK